MAVVGVVQLVVPVLVPEELDVQLGLGVVQVPFVLVDPFAHELGGVQLLPVPPLVQLGGGVQLLPVPPLVQLGGGVQLLPLPPLVQLGGGGGIVSGVR